MKKILTAVIALDAARRCWQLIAAPILVKGLESSGAGPD